MTDITGMHCTVHCKKFFDNGIKQMKNFINFTKVFSNITSIIFLQIWEWNICNVYERNSKVYKPAVITFIKNFVNFDFEHDLRKLY